MRDFLGGSPLSVFGRLLFLSVLVGAALSFLNVTPVDLLSRVMRVFSGLSADVVQNTARWTLYGAMLVIPIWLVVRLSRRNMA